MSIDRRQFIAALSTTALITACSGDDDDELATPSSTEEPMNSDTALPNRSADSHVTQGSIQLAVKAASSPPADVPFPKAAIITRWRADRFARGSYSYLAAAATPADRDALRATVDGAVFFAGEATSLDFASTVHGALLEGRAAADRINETAEDGDRIAIIGAGIAGLAAARQLTDQGYETFVLEGRERIGGRIHTDESFGFPYDLGAAWVHGDDGNPLVELIEQADVETVVMDTDDIVVYDSNGDEIDIDELEEVFAEFEEIDTDDTRTFDRILDDELEDADDETAAIVRYLAIATIEHDESGSLADITPFSVDAGEDIDGDELVFPGGYSGILAPLTRGVTIDTDQIVTAISHDDEGVLIDLEDGAQAVCDRVLVTVPLGVLKAGDIAFEPPLPEAKRSAIQRIGMGVLNRVVLRFDEKFWDDSTIIGFVNDQEGLFIEWYDMTDIVGEPVLVGFNAADVADDLETLTDEKVIELALRTLITIYRS